MKHRLELLLVLVLALPATAMDKLIPLTPAQRASLRIATAPLTAHPGAVSVGLPATVAVPPAQERVVAAPVAGLVTEIKVATGDTVRAGQVLAALVSEELVAGQRELMQAVVQARLAVETVQRDESLYREGIIPEARLQGSRANLAQANALLEERRAWLRLMGLGRETIQGAEAGRLTDRLLLTAPIGGVVLEQMAVSGTRAQAATPLIRVARLDPLWLEIQAPAEVAVLVKKGQKVKVPGTRAEGQVISVGGSLDAAQTVMIRARVTNPDGGLRLNQNVSVRIEELAGAKQWRVPVRALARAQGQTWVFVERAGGFEPQPVKVLSQSAQSAAIDGAFTGEEKVAVEGVATLKAAWQGMGGGE